MPEEFNPEELESALNEMETVDEFNSTIDFEKFIVLSKKDLSNFCRIVEPLTKQAIDEYGKSILVRCLSDEVVELRYINNPYKVVATVTNKSGKQVKSFVVNLNTFKKLITASCTSLILVEENNEINIALCESLLYLETKPLREDQFDFTKREVTETIDKELASYTFRKIGASLSLTERASEKTVVVHGGQVHFNTGVFSSKSKSPFSGSEEFVLYKQVSDVIATMAELSKAGLRYAIYDDVMVIDCDDQSYAEVGIGGQDKIQQFLSPTADAALKFDAPISIINDNLLRLVSTVRNLDYLSNIVTLRFTNDTMEFEIASSNQSKKSNYTFNLVDGKPEVTGEMKLTAEVLQMFLNIAGHDCTYAFNNNGLGIQTQLGKFLIRKS